MKANQAARKPRLLPGEVAFDRCFLPLAALSIFNVIFFVTAWWFSPPADRSGDVTLNAALQPHLWHEWLWFALGLFLAILWVRGLTSLVAAWRDPSSRVLRFSASILLIPFALVAGRLLLTPFQ